MGKFIYQHTLSTIKDKKPESLKDGQIAVNVFAENEKMWLKNTEGEIIPFVPEHTVDEKISDSTKDIEKTITDNELVVAEALNDINNKIGNFFDDVSYNDSTKSIDFKQGTTTKASVDASAFIKDGMVNSVSIIEKSGDKWLKITFNTDAGKEDIELNIGDLFDSGNYLTKAETNTAISTEATTRENADKALETKIETEETRATTVEDELKEKIKTLEEKVAELEKLLTDDEKIISSAFNDLNDRLTAIETA